MQDFLAIFCRGDFDLLEISDKFVSLWMYDIKLIIGSYL